MQALQEGNPKAKQDQEGGSQTKQTSVQLRKDNTALVIIDVQTRMDGWKEWRDETNNIKTLIEQCKAKGLPIIVVSMNPDAIKEESFSKYPALKMDDLRIGHHPDNYVRIIPELQTTLADYNNTIYVEKATENAFDDPRHGLEKALKEKGIENAVIVGFNENVCVKSTVESSVKGGYAILTSTETMWGSQHNEEVEWMRQAANEFYGNNTQKLSFNELLEAVANAK